ncbi:hypothetical protein NU195Hw_g4419t1 [Hortaea werneckii]
MYALTFWVYIETAGAVAERVKTAEPLPCGHAATAGQSTVWSMMKAVLETSVHGAAIVGVVRVSSSSAPLPPRNAPDISRRCVAAFDNDIGLRHESIW